MVTKIEIKGVGEFEVKHDLLHRGNRPRLKLYNSDKYKEVSFNSYVDDYMFPTFQMGYDYEGNEIQIKVLTEN